VIFFNEWMEIGSPMTTPTIFLNPQEAGGGGGVNP